MNTAYIRFYEELNDFLPEEKKKTRFPYQFWGTPSVKDVIEANGVPHTEVDMILINGQSVNFSFRISNSDDISVYPVFESLDISEIQHLRPAPLRNPKFVLDVHLGILSKYMRMLGFDCLYRNDFRREEIIRISNEQKRTILTKDVEILKRNEVTHGYRIRGSSLQESLKEVINRFNLHHQVSPFSRCMNCNSELNDIKKEEITHKLPPKVKEGQDEFKICCGCGKIYWKGTHYKRMKDFIDELKNSL